MTPEPARAKSIFLAAADISDPAERFAYLERECGADAALRDRVVALLRADSPSPAAPSAGDVTGTFADESQATGAFALDAPAQFDGSARKEGAGELIDGKFELIEQIGEGGMGSVWRAQQFAPVKREVAVKLIKAGTDSRTVLSRFDAERQALALMDHPNIARIFDGGVTATGQPYFVMELVRGVPLTDYCDQKRLPVEARLNLFVQVCQAVQHAHQKGIIHRDLKPGNVLVTEVDGRATPKVIDFGVAKATEHKLTDMTFSDAEAIVGTPAYMSPEQADPSSMDIDTRTDVYALGVMLYELLTGFQPLDAAQFKRGAVLEMLRMVREVDPPRPSTKISTADSLPNIAANRAIEPADLRRLLSGELDWVVMKALEKDRSRRYDTALGLAQDVQRYLADEVVEARPPSRGYRARKFVRRNRGQVIGVCAVAVALLGGTALATWQAVRATRAEENQRAARQIAEDLAGKNSKLAQDEAEQRKRAERERTIAVEERARADEARLTAETSKYALQLSLSSHDLARNDFAAALKTLAATKPEVRGWEYHRLVAQCRARMREFAVNGGHTCVAITGNGRTVAGGSNQLIQLWDFDTRHVLAELGGDGSVVEAMAFSPDDTRLAVATDTSVRVWDVASKRELGKVALAPSKFARARLAFDAKGSRLAVAHGEIRIWDAVLSKELLSVKPDVPAPEQGYFGAVSFDPTGERLAVRLMIDQPPGARDKWAPEEYLLLDVSTGKTIASSGREQTGTGGVVRGQYADAIGFDPMRKWFFTSGGSRLKFREPTTAKVVRETEIGTCNSVAMSGDGQTLAVLPAVERRADVFQLPELDAKQSYPFAEPLFHFPKAIGISSDGSRMVTVSKSAGNEGRIVGWVLRGDDTTLAVSSPKGSMIGGVATCAAAGWVAVGRGGVEPIDRQKALEQKLPTRPKQLGWVDFYGVQTGKLLFSLPKREERLAWVNASKDGRLLVTAGTAPDMPVRVWDVATRQEKHELRATTEAGTKTVVVHLSTDSEAKRVCATIADHKVTENGRLNQASERYRAVVWDSATGAVVWQTEWNDKVLWLTSGSIGAVLDPSGTRVAVLRCRNNPDADADAVKSNNTLDLFVSTATVYRIADRAQLGQLERKGPATATFSPAGEHLYLSGDGVARWDFVSGDVTRVTDLAWHRVVVTPNGERLLALEMALSQPGIIRVLDLNTRQEVYRIPNETMRYSYNGVQITSDGKTVVLHDFRTVLLLRGE